MRMMKNLSRKQSFWQWIKNNTIEYRGFKKSDFRNSNNSWHNNNNSNNHN